MNGKRMDAIEKYIMQALGHRERRDILRIIGTTLEGIPYSDILNELSINTGKLNYQLKIIESLTENKRQKIHAVPPRETRFADLELFIRRY
jgi:hypothetical protein